MQEPVYEAVEDDEGGEGEDCDDNRGSSRHLEDHLDYQQWTP